MTQEALAHGLAPQSPLGGHAAWVAMRFRLENEGAFCQIPPPATQHSLLDSWSVWPLFGSRSKTDSLNAAYGAVLGGMAHQHDVHVRTGIADDAQPFPADMQPGHAKTPEEALWLAPGTGLDGLAVWTSSLQGSADIFMS
ncbi:MAG: hypothetical protein EBX37_07495 [Alphaproteobacteria bacterium]|nr:hypothetical protein [Alphaproteobacteria bacterium]